MIELVNHETILEQMKKDMEIEKENAIRLAIKQECDTLFQDLKVAKAIIKKNKEDSDIYRQQEAALLEECRHYKSTMQQLNEARSVIQKLEMDKVALDHKLSTQLEKVEQHENYLHLLEV
jgi:hypothetical protein